MILKNDVLSIQDSRVGLYKKGGIVNGKRSWTTDSQAIWFVPQFLVWAIGPLEDIGGTQLVAITSYNDKDQSLFDVPNDRWQYWDSEFKDIKDGDITIKCVDTTGNFHIP